MSRHYVSNSNESVRMFENRFLEFCSHVHPVAPLVIYVPVIGWMLYSSIWQRHLGFAIIAGLFLLGVLIWSLVEYLVHRHVFHYEPKTKLGQQLHFMVHGVHHDYPNDATRLVLPPSVSIPLAVVFYALFALALGRNAPPAFAGFGCGYLFYDMVHYATHHFAMRQGVWLWLKQYHMRHHYKDEHVGFGVSSPFWDYVFGSREKRASTPPSIAYDNGDAV